MPGWDSMLEACPSKVPIPIIFAAGTACTVDTYCTSYMSFVISHLALFVLANPILCVPEWWRRGKSNQIPHTPKLENPTACRTRNAYKHNHGNRAGVHLAKHFADFLESGFFFCRSIYFQGEEPSQKCQRGRVILALQDANSVSPRGASPAF